MNNSYLPLLCSFLTASIAPLIGGAILNKPMSLTGIGRVLGISRDRVRNLERDGLRGLRRLSDNVEAYFVS